LIARELFKRHKEIKKMLWGGEFWTDGFYINTVGQFSTLKIIEAYVRNQGKSYKRLYTQSPLF
jgi:REP element-mobilizing transposase RayT